MVSEEDTRMNQKNNRIERANTATLLDVASAAPCAICYQGDHSADEHDACPKLIPEMLTHWRDGAQRYEAWRTPEVAPGYHLYYFLGGVEVGRHPHASEMLVRKAFEGAVEAHATS
jgi:hypothetical protein